MATPDDHQFAASLSLVPSVFHAGMDYREFWSMYVYPFLVRLVFLGFRVILHSDDAFNNQVISPDALFWYAMSLPLSPDNGNYRNLCIRAVVDIDITSICPSIGNLSLILHRSAQDTLEVVNEFDIDVCRIRMISDQLLNTTFSAPYSVIAHVRNKQMLVIYRHVAPDDTETSNRTHKRRQRYERRGYAATSIATEYNYDFIEYSYDNATTEYTPE